MSTPHRVTWGARLALENTPGQAVVLTDADYLLLCERPTVARTPLNDGDTGADPRGTGDRPSVEQSGWTGETTLAFHARGNSARYTPTIVPLELHRALRLAGHEARFSEQGDGGRVARTWLYSPAYGEHNTVGAVEVQTQGRRFALSTAVATGWSLEADAAGIVTARVQVRGLSPRPVNAPEMNAALYDTATPPFVFNGRGRSVSPVLGTWAGAVIRGWKLEQAFEHATRAHGLTAGAVAGVALGRRVTTLSLRVEAGTLSQGEFNPYLLRESGDPFFLSLALRAGGNPGWEDWLHIVSERAQVAGCTEVDGLVAGWDVTLRLTGIGSVAPYHLWLSQVETQV